WGRGERGRIAPPMVSVPLTAESAGNRLGYYTYLSSKANPIGGSPRNSQHISDSYVAHPDAKHGRARQSDQAAPAPSQRPYRWRLDYTWSFSVDRNSKLSLVRAIR